LGETVKAPSPVLINNKTNGISNAHDIDYTSTDDIVNKLTTRQKKSSLDLITKFYKSGQLAWNSSGEIILPGSSVPIRGSNIRELLWYHSIPNKTNTPTPKGYNEFVKAIGRMRQTTLEPASKVSARISNEVAISISDHTNLFLFI